MPTRLRVAVVEDDRSQAELLSHWLGRAGHLCSQHERGSTFVRTLKEESFDAVVLDWGLPDISGVDLLRYVRGALQSQMPVLLVSGRTRETDVVKALNEGADDYMVKPVRRQELLARLEAITRRKREAQPPQVIDLGALRIDRQSRTVWRNGRAIHLTAKDFDLAVTLALNLGRLLSRADLHRAVWGRVAALNSRTLDTHICRIRDKLELTPSRGWHLAAIYGHGYRLQKVAQSAPQASFASALRQHNPTIERG